ncbi:MAG: GNAT family N-acetyltransferase [Vulcanimicrobiota bacterium]
MDRLETCRALARSLIDDPFYRALQAGLDSLTSYMQASWREAERIGRVDTLGPQGAALWMTAGRPDLLAAARQEKLESFQRFLSPVGLANYLTMVAAMDTNLPGLLPEGCWYLSILGVAPELQGQGWGARLLAPALATGQPAYLETFGERSLKFYERLGFEVVGRFEEPLTASDYWVMLRTSRTS